MGWMARRVSQPHPEASAQAWLTYVRNLETELDHVTAQRDRLLALVERGRNLCGRAGALCFAPKAPDGAP